MNSYLLLKRRAWPVHRNVFTIKLQYLQPATWRKGDCNIQQHLPASKPEVQVLHATQAGIKPYTVDLTVDLMCTHACLLGGTHGCTENAQARITYQARSPQHAGSPCLLACSALQAPLCPFHAARWHSGPQ